MHWFRMYSEFVSDPVVQSLAFEDQRHFVALLCLKCNGTLDKSLPDDAKNRIVARGLGLDVTSADEVRRRLGEVGLIDPNSWQPSNWDKRQFVSDSGNALGNAFGNSVTYHAEKQRRYRERKRLKEKDSGNALRNGVVTVTPPELDTDTEKTDFPNGKSLSGVTPDAPPPKARKTPLARHRDEAVSVLAFLNEKCGRSFPANDTNLTLIAGRIAEGFDADTCRQVIVRRWRAWKDDDDMREYLRPKTIFGKQNFSQYVGELGHAG